MNEVSNYVVANGTYDSIPTSIASNTSVVNLVDGLTLSIDADKKNWLSGNLTYTITLNNQTNLVYTNVSLKDVLDVTKIGFVTGSVKINDVEATSSEYSYDDGTNTLTVNLDNVAESSTTTVTFCVKKKI